MANRAFWQHGLAAMAALGMVAAGPAAAQVRAADSLPAAGVQLEPAGLERANEPLFAASELRGSAFPGAFLVIVALLAVLVAAGGSDGGNDSPG